MMPLPVASRPGTRQRTSPAPEPEHDGAADGPVTVTVTLDRVGAAATLLTTWPGGANFTSTPIDAVLCVRRPGSNGIGVSPATGLNGSCSSVRPISFPETLALGFETNQILYKVPITMPGTYKGFGMVVAYHLGTRTGTLRETADTSLIATG